MKMDLTTTYKRAVVIGMQGSGKTYVSKQIIKQFKKPIVYGVYPEEWENESNKITLFIPKNFTSETFDLFAKNLIESQRNPENKNKYDALFIDDADLFFTHNFSSHENINRLFISMRQIGLSIVLMSKRPQNLSTKTYENADYVLVFAVEGTNVKKYLENLHEDMKTLMPQLSREKHNFIYKEIGKKPQLIKAVRN